MLFLFAPGGFERYSVARDPRAIRSGDLADNYGRRRIFVIGAAVLAAALMTGALATASWLFVAARVVSSPRRSPSR